MKMEQLRPGLARIEVPSPTLPPATCTNAWILGQQDVIVIDPAGKNDDVRRLFYQCLQKTKIRAILLTHHHNDHICGAKTLSEQTGAPIWASQWTKDKTHLPIEKTIIEGEVIQTDQEEWITMITPGHANGHICLYSKENGDIIAGDMVAGIGTILLAKPEGCLEHYFNSLRRLISTKPTRLLPAHGPAIQPAVDYLESYIAHRQLRNDQILDSIRQQKRDSKSIAKNIYVDLPAMFIPLAIEQVECHLEWLIAKSMVIHQDGKFYLKEI